MFVYFNFPKGTQGIYTQAYSLNLKDDNLRENEGLFDEAFSVHRELLIRNEFIG
jgi:hypothetical protein